MRRRPNVLCIIITRANTRVKRRNAVRGQTAVFEARAYHMAASIAKRGVTPVPARNIV